MSDAPTPPPVAPGDASPDAPPPPPPRDGAGPRAVRALRVVRWQGLVPLLLLVVLLVTGWRLFADRIITAVVEEAATEAIGTQVDVDGLHLALGDAKLTVRRLQVAHPFDTTRNLVDAGPFTVDLDAEALLRKKVIVERLSVEDSRWGTRREVPARAVRGPSFAGEALAAMRRFAEQFDVPPLQLLPLDTLKALALNPAELGTVKAAQALIGRADSVEQVIEGRVQALRLQAVVDTARAVVAKYEKASPRSLGLAGTRQAVADVRGAVREVEDAKRRLDSLAKAVEASGRALRDGVAAVDSARRADYAFARSLVQLPTFEGPDLGRAILGPVSIDRFQQAVYYAGLAERWLPPGLKPRETPGPKRTRLAGTTVRFPLRQALPSFLLKRGDVAVTLVDAAGRTTRVAALVGDVTTEPALVGRPMLAGIDATADPTTGVTRLAARAVLDHLGEVARDSVRVRAEGIALPEIPIPGLPLVLDPRAGRAALTFVKDGEALRGRWEVEAPGVAWRPDSAALAGRSDLERFAVSVFTRIPRLSLTAELSGTLERPALRVRSNLDAALSQALQERIGEEVRKAEAKVRAEVDRQVAKVRAEAEARAAAVQAEGERRVAELRARLDAEKAALEARLRALGGGLLGA